MRMHSGRATIVKIAGLLISVLMAGTGSATPIDPGDSSLSMLGALPGGNLNIDTGDQRQRRFPAYA